MGKSIFNIVNIFVFARVIYFVYFDIFNQKIVGSLDFILYIL